MIGKFPEVIDSSMLADFKACPWKFYLTNIQQWKPKGVSTHLHAGAAFARGLEVVRRAYYEGVKPLYHRDPATGKMTSYAWGPLPNGNADPETAIALGVDAVLIAYGDHQPPAFGTAANKTALRMAGALEFYFSRYPLNHQTAYPIIMPGGRRGIEFSFVHPLSITNPDTGEPLLFSGRADGIFQFAGGTYIFDDKTASQLGATWAKQWKLRGQFSGYAWAARESQVKVDGIVVRGVSILKERYDTLEDISFRSEHMINTWYGETLEWIERMIWCYQNKRWVHNFDHACSDFGGCGFQDSCDMEDQDPWLERSHERKHWDPVTRVETKLEEPPK